MQQSENYSVEELRRRSDEVRAELASTVGELREKVSDTASEIKTLVSPSHIKEEIKTYIREERESLRQSLERKIRENPLQAAALGAAVAYPAWGLLRAIPAPFLMIGAGLWLTTSKGRKTIKQVNATVSEAVEQGAERASEIAGELQSSSREGADAVGRSYEEAREAVSSQAGGLTHKARVAAHDMRDATVSQSSAVTGSIADAANNMVARSTQTVSQATNGASGTVQKSKSAVMNFVETNPLLVAGIGAAVGAFIAASLPRSDTENKLLGGEADKLKDKALDAAAQGLEKGQKLAADIVDDVAQAAAREGVDGAGIQRAVQDVTSRVKAVAERGVRTAVGESPPESSQQTNQFTELPR